MPHRPFVMCFDAAYLVPVSILQVSQCARLCLDSQLAGDVWDFATGSQARHYGAFVANAINNKVEPKPPPLRAGNMRRYPSLYVGGGTLTGSSAPR